MTAVNAKPASRRASRTWASVWKYWRCCSAKVSPSAARSTSMRVSHVRAARSTTLLMVKCCPSAVPVTTGFAIVKSSIAVGVQVEDQPAAGPQPPRHGRHGRAELGVGR